MIVAVRRRFTDRSHGDLAVGQDPALLARRRAAVVDRPWLWLHQVHGVDVVTVTAATEVAVLAGTAADAAVTDRAGVVLAIHSGDCVPVLLSSPEGVIGAAHAGWRGLEGGVVGATVAAMRALGATTVDAVVGPHIGPGCYEFGAADLDRLGRSLGAEVASVTGAGRPALDLARAVRASLAGHADVTVTSWAGTADDADTADIADIADTPPATGTALAADVDDADPACAAGTCTACARDAAGDPRWFSLRARTDAGRQASLIWIEP